MHLLTGYYHQKKAAALLWQHLSITAIHRWSWSKNLLGFHVCCPLQGHY